MLLGRQSRLLVQVLTLLALVLFVAGCTGQTDRSSAGAAALGGDSSDAKDGSVGTADGKTAPDFTLQTLGGETVNLADTAGQIRLIDFWATWCVPCVEEIPMLNDLQAEYGDRGFRVYAISDEEAGLIREFVEDHGVKYTNLVGTEEVTEAYGVLGLPAAYLLDQEGRVVDSFFGPKPRKVLVEKIEALLPSTPAT